MLTGVVCFLAIVQITGRFALANLSAFTPYINTALVPHRSEVSQVSGDWRGFNPVLRVERLSFAAGHLKNVYIELDFFSTIAKGKPIFRRFFCETGEVGVVHTPQGWALKNSSELPIDIDFYELLRSSEFVETSLELNVERADEAFGFSVNLTLNNDPSNKYGRLVIDSPGATQPLDLVYDLGRSAVRRNACRLMLCRALALKVSYKSLRPFWEAQAWCWNCPERAGRDGKAVAPN